MKKILNIAWKDLRVNFRDPAGLLVMLATPLALTLVIAFAFGRLGGGSSNGLQVIPVLLVNQDVGEVGDIIVDAFASEELADLVAAELSDDIVGARSRVDNGEAAALILIPESASESVFTENVPDDLQALPAQPVHSVIEIYADPTRPVSTAVVRGVVDGIISQISSGRATVMVSILQMMAGGVLSPAEASSERPAICARTVENALAETRVSVHMGETPSTPAGFDWLAYMAPSMAILSLMFTVSNGGRSVLSERDWGTLPRMLVSPSSSVQVLGGKVTGIFMTGFTQMVILFLASRLLFNLSWGNPVAVLALTVALCAAATGWGILLAAYARTPGQAAAIGTGVSLVFGGLAGNFLPRAAFPEWFGKLSLFTPNAWGLDGFSLLAAGGTVTDIAGILLALAGMAGVLFLVAVYLFRRQYA